jgi:predicted transcriptional regulator
MIRRSKLAGGKTVAADRELPEAQRQPAVTVRSSVKPDYIVCLDCGVKVKTLKRHLQSAHGLDPKQYRERWGLKTDYPMTARAYSKRRSAMAQQIGLGRKAAERRKSAKVPARRSGRNRAEPGSSAE